MKIAYLNPDASQGGIQIGRCAIISHPDSIIYSLEEFITAFNHEEISDLGYIALIKNLNMEKMLVHKKKKGE